MNVQEKAFQIIANSGDSLSYSMEALNAIQNHNIEEGERLLKEADEKLLSAHKAHTELLVAEAKGESIEFSMFLMHSESHLNNAEISKSYVSAILQIYKEKGDK